MKLTLSKRNSEFGKKDTKICVLFALAAFGLADFIGCDARIQPNKVAKSAEAQPLFKPEAATLTQQKMCDEQAEKKFHDDEGTALYGDNKPIYSYTSHYDPVVNVCYVRIHSFGGKPPSVSDLVYDAFGGRVYATIYGTTPSTRNIRK
jgi:hypothetical protein